MIPRHGWPILMMVALASGCAVFRPELPRSGSAIRPGRECRTVEQLLAPAAPEPIAARRIKRVLACPALAGRALAAGLVRLRASSDTAQLERATGLGHELHDETLWRAALALAGDRGAAPVARIFAFRELVWTMAPAHRVSFRDMLDESVGAIIRRGGGSNIIHYYSGYFQGDLARPAVGVLPPADFVEQTGTLCRRVAADEREAEIVRRAARITCSWKPDAQLLALRTRHVR